MNRGIYTVANDKVVNQLISFLNSIQRNWPNHYTVCVIPYDQHCEKVKDIVRKRNNVVMFDDEIALQAFDRYIGNLWMQQEEIVATWQKANKHVPHRLGMHRRFLGLTQEGLFDEYVYLDVDTFVFKPMDKLLDMLIHFDIVAHDFQGIDPSHVFNVESLRLPEFLNGTLADQIQCGGLMVNKKGTFSNEEWLSIPKLLKEDINAIYPWAPIQSLWCWMFNKFQKSFVNLVRYWPEEQITHDAQTYTKFEFRDGKLYEGEKEVLYFHHIGVPAEEFNRICEGKEPRHEFRYRDVFEYYRFLE